MKTDNETFEREVYPVLWPLLRAQCQGSADKASEILPVAWFAWKRAPQCPLWWIAFSARRQMSNDQDIPGFRSPTNYKRPPDGAVWHSLRALYAGPASDPVHVASINEEISRVYKALRTPFEVRMTDLLLLGHSQYAVACLLSVPSTCVPDKLSQIKRRILGTMKRRSKAKR